MINIKDEFYVVEVCRGSGIYLESYDYDIENKEGYITNTTKDILSKNIIRITDPNDLTVVNDIKNDAFSEDPVILKVNIELRTEEV